MDKSSVKATISIGDKVITIEGPQSFVDEQLAKLTTPHITSGYQGTGSKGEESGGVGAEAGTERQLIQEKRPGNHPETVAVLAFCLVQGGVEEFTEEDIRRAYLRAAVRPPKVVGQALRDAKNNFDFIEAGAERGRYRLTNHGERTVRFDLPKGK